jgi:VIT1/CCC1 family predicted Fe2+/Mn2+ transporter
VTFGTSIPHLSSTVRNDILSTASLTISVDAASDIREPIVLATLEGLVAGVSMAAGEYVSVSSQTDVENTDIERERIEQEETPELELQLLAAE